MWRREGFATASVAGAIAREGTTPSYVSPIGMDWNVWSISESRQLMNRHAQLVVGQAESNHAAIVGVAFVEAGPASPDRASFCFVPERN
jgi:hypothetical protein